MAKVDTRMNPLLEGCETNRENWTKLADVNIKKHEEKTQRGESGSEKDVDESEPTSTTSASTSTSTSTTSQQQQKEGAMTQLS